MSYVFNNQHRSKQKKKIIQRCETDIKKTQKKKLAYNMKAYTFPHTVFAQLLMSFPCGHNEEVKHKTSQL